jgi:hypothetical protein
MKRSTRYRMFAGSLALASVIEFVVACFKVGSPYIIQLCVAIIVAMGVQLIFAMPLMSKATTWSERENNFFNATGTKAPCSYEDVEAMKAIYEQLASLFVPVRDAMVELSLLKGQRLTTASLERCAELEEQIRKGRDHYSQCREVALPFLTLPFWLPSERKLSEAVNERLYRQPWVRYQQQ